MDPTPKIYAIRKRSGESTRSLLNRFKLLFPVNDRIGHFGTLDPFATGLVLVGSGGAAKLNDIVHDNLTKTYLAVGKLGIGTDTGDYTGKIVNQDDSEYAKKVIARFDLQFLNQEFQKRFLGTYMQSPHSFSAAKHDGKPLHVWAREGVLIKKEEVKREIHAISVVKYNHPYLIFNATVSSGTYIRTLFEEMAFHLGTVGSLLSLTRTAIGNIVHSDAQLETDWDDLRPIPLLHAVPIPIWELEHKEARLFCHGVLLTKDRGVMSGEIVSPHVWVRYKEELLGVARPEGEYMRLVINFKNRFE